jgi:hypothetical protein
VTGNANKLREVKEILSAGGHPIEIVSQELDGEFGHHIAVVLANIDGSSRTTGYDARSRVGKVSASRNYGALVLSYTIFILIHDYSWVDHASRRTLHFALTP